MSLPQQFKQKATAVGETALSEVAPRLFRGVISGWLEGKTAEHFYKFVKDHAGQNWITEMVPPRAQGRIHAFAKSGMDWLTVEWFLGAIIKEHPDIASLIASSPEVKAELEKQLENIQAGLRLDKT